MPALPDLAVPDLAALAALVCAAFALTRLLAARADNRRPWAAAVLAALAVAAGIFGLRADPGALEPERMAMTVIRLVGLAVN